MRQSAVLVSPSFRSKLVAALLFSLLLSSEALAQTPPPEPSPPAAPPDQGAPLPPAPPPPTPEKYPRVGKNNELYLGKDFWIRFGAVAQAWFDYAQSSNKVMDGDGGYSTNFLLRRARFIGSASFFGDLFVYVLLDAPRIGTAVQSGTAMAPVVNKFGTGALVQDMFGEIKLYGDQFMLTAGLMFIPFSRHDLGSSTTRLGLDTAFTGALMPNTSGSRDTGFQLKGYVLEDHLEYRVGVFSGARQVATGNNPVAHNAPRVTGYLQYNFLDTEKGYVYPGYNFGKKMVLGVGAGFDFQKNDSPQTDAYSAFSATVYGSYPLAGDASKDGGDEIAFEAMYQHFDGGGTAGAAPTLFAQNDFNVEAQYYNKGLSLGVFGKFELQKFADDPNTAGDTTWVGGGLKYFVRQAYCNFTLAYLRAIFPNKPATKNDTNELTLQLQVYLY